MRLRVGRSLGISFCGVFLAGALVSCAPPGSDEPEEQQPLPEEEAATVDESEVALQPQAETVWNCGLVKQHVFALVNTLVAAEEASKGHIAAVVALEVAAEAAAIAATASPESEEALGNLVSEASDTLRNLLGEQPAEDEEAAANAEAQAEIAEAVEAARSGFTDADEIALNAACELYGQHQTALEFWRADNRGDACDVWRPAKQTVDTAQEIVAISVLHPLVSKFWLGATGSVSEGSGRCIAELRN